MSNTETNIVDLAAWVASKAHRGQVDQSGAAYISHPARVAAAMRTERERAVAWLHDVVEDTHVTLAEIEAQFGPDIAADIDAISRRKHEPAEAYYARVKSRPVALAVKLADINDNASEARLAKLPEAEQNRLRAKYAKARRHLLDEQHAA